MSLALPDSQSYRDYIQNGISFKIREHSKNFVTDQRGQLPGEIYIKDMVHINKIIAIQIPSDLKNKMLTDLDICHLNYGSISGLGSYHEKLKFLFWNALPADQIKYLATQYDEIIKDLREVPRRVANEVPLHEKMGTLNRAIVEMNDKINNISLQCSRLYLKCKLKNKYDQFTVYNFIQYQLNQRNLKIPIVII